MSSDPTLIATLARIETKVDDLRTAVADLASRVTALETSEKHRESALDRRFTEADRRFVALEDKVTNLTTKAEATQDEVVEARGSVKALRWGLGTLAALGLGGGVAVGVADGAVPAPSAEAVIEIAEAAASAVP